VANHWRRIRRIFSAEADRPAVIASGCSARGGAQGLGGGNCRAELWRHRSHVVDAKAIKSDGAKALLLGGPSRAAASFKAESRPLRSRLATGRPMER